MTEIGADNVLSPPKLINNACTWYLAHQAVQRFPCLLVRGQCNALNTPDQALAFLSPLPEGDPGEDPGEGPGEDSAVDHQYLVGTPAACQRGQEDWVSCLCRLGIEIWVGPVGSEIEVAAPVTEVAALLVTGVAVRVPSVVP